MGMFKLFSDGKTSEITSTTQTSPNPNPYRFEVKAERHVGKYAVIHVHYPDCTTFGGHKVLVYDNHEKWTALCALKKVDPHFLEYEYSPCARFPATAQGWDNAIAFASMMTQNGG